MVELEDLDVIMVAGGGHRMSGKDVDIRVQVPTARDDVSFSSKELSNTEILDKVSETVDTLGVCAMVEDLLGEIPVDGVDGGVTIWVDGIKKSAMFDSSGKFIKILDFLLFEWCYYIQRSGMWWMEV